MRAGSGLFCFAAREGTRPRAKKQPLWGEGGESFRAGARRSCTEAGCVFLTRSPGT